RKMKFLERNSNEQIIVNNTSAVVATSDQIINVFKSYYNIPLQKVLYFPPGVDDIMFRPRDKAECKKTWQYLARITGIKENDLMKRKIIFETSRMDQTKRKDLLVRAFQSLPDKYDDALLIIGGGPENKVFKGLKDLIRSSKTSKKIFLTGFIPDEFISEMFSIATIFASASEMEGFGISVLNAASSGVPLISSDLIPFSVQYVRDSSLIVGAGDIQGFAEGMKQYLDDEGLREKNASKSLKVSNDFKWKGLTKKLVSDLRRLGIV
ncbi:MAG: glycosyltransferase, partial [Spirochaetes bacterium]|nr:glycosyltransferase [Spirochaetota bacterium]